jgi:hypothetical protein
MKQLPRWGLAVLFLIVAVSARPASAQNIRRDGNWWRVISLDQKHSYMVGFFDGLALGHNFSYGNLKDKDSKPDIAEQGRVMEAYDESYNLLKNTTNGQFVEGLDKLYDDYRNRRIMVLDAAWIVVLSISGMPDKDMEILLNNSRKNALIDK